MQTSYYNKYVGLKGISISQTTPPTFIGPKYLKLAPPWELIRRYKRDNDHDYFVREYKRAVLSKLDAKQVYEELGDDAVLLCWEKDPNICHRKIVADWFKEELGIEVTEWY